MDECLNTAQLTGRVILNMQKRGVDVLSHKPEIASIIGALTQVGEEHLELACELFARKLHERS